MILSMKFSYRKCVTTGLIANKSISVLLVDDHTMFLEDLRSLLKMEGDIELVGEAQNGRQAVALVEQLRPAVVVMDIGMPSLNGLEAIRTGIIESSVQLTII
jgi:DNA-binding NarL/FixJ family response regulator